MMAPPDRLELLRNQNQVTGLDFVYVHPDQRTLDVFFLRSPATLAVPLVNDLPAERISIAGIDAATPSPVPVTAVAWDVVDGRDALRLTTGFPGGFSRYLLHIDDARLDPFLDALTFSFKANCPSDLDCEPPPHECPPDDDVDVLIDYRARDFWSFRRALLDFASQRYPDWKDRLEADAGVMLAEVLSALADDLAYYQDRVSREAHFETATQRRSLRRHARLVDYDIHDGLGASAWLDVTVQAGMAGAIPAGMDVWALGDAGRRVPFEAGRGLSEVIAGATYAVDAARNSFQPHLSDNNLLCLPVGTTELVITGHHAADLPFDDLPPDRAPGKWVLLQTKPEPGMPARALPVRLITIVDEVDPLVDDPITGHDITRLVWEPEQATPFELDLMVLEVRCNLVPATAGRTEMVRFAIRPDPDMNPDDFPIAIERVGPNGSIAHLFGLPDPQEEGLVWHSIASGQRRPEIDLVELEAGLGGYVEAERWDWRRALIGTNSSQPGERHFALDDGSWRRVVGYWRGGAEVVHDDYASGHGWTVRFGDDEFGMTPPNNTLFQATYRLGNGRPGNLPARSLTQFDPAFAFIESVTNPLPATGGVDPEEADTVRQLAPDAFRAVVYRAVRPEDYAEAAERLPWVQRAGAAFRWTGSWLSAFVTPDPRGAAALETGQRRDLVDQLDRFRQTGREAHVLAPVYADLDLEITVCAQPTAFPGDVQERVRDALLGSGRMVRVPGFFSPDNFTFGTPLIRSSLEAAIQHVPGVRAVEDMMIRRRGWFDWRPLTELIFEVGRDEVIRLENDQRHPDRGSLRIVMEGGA